MFGLTAVIDGTTHVTVLGFAAWTLVYDIGLAAHLATSLMLATWAVCLAVILAAVVRFRRPPSAPPLTGQQVALHTGPAPAGWRALGIAGLVLGVGAGLAAGAHHTGVPWAWTWVLGALSVATTGAWLLRPGHSLLPGHARQQEGAGGSLLAAGTAVVAAISSLYIVRPNADDAYYVSRSVWTAQHGQIPVRDVMFTNQAIPSIGGEPPISSIEVLIGALARLLGISAGSLTYLVALPVLTFFAVWAVWMLVRRWAPGRYGAVFAVAMVYLAWGGASGASFGSFHLVRMWQGKAAFVSVMVPLLYAYLTDWAERRSWRDLVLVGAAGIAAAGLSSAAVYVVPLVAAAVAIPLLLARQLRSALGAMLAAAYPLAAGLIIAALAPITHLPNVKMAAPTMWAWVLMAGTFGAIGGIAVWTAPRLARYGVPALITAGIAAVATVLMVPGVLARVADATGSGPVMWRTLWMIPGPVVVGLLACVRLPPLAYLPRPAARWLAPAAALLLSGVLIGTGIPLWSHQSAATTVASRPSWKYQAGPLAVAERILRADRQPGDLLSTAPVMQAVPLLTTRVHSVSPRNSYLSVEFLSVSPQFVADRLLLTNLADRARPLPTEAAVRAALARVDVGYACVHADNVPALTMLERAGFTRAARFWSYQCMQSSR